MDILERIDFMLGENIPLSNPGTTTADIAKTPEKNVLGLRKKRKKRLDLVKTTANMALSPL